MNRRLILSMCVLLSCVSVPEINLSKCISECQENNQVCLTEADGCFDNLESCLDKANECSDLCLGCEETGTCSNNDECQNICSDKANSCLDDLKPCIKEKEACFEPFVECISFCVESIEKDVNG